ncbi:hypothetical protein VNO78_29444 [Psophocarpus tetragonolobus]|uniref:Uncharacterized protein n=1 Tax=Psophocarpus tetragonolobus TaxID=3891 RepID=A0AAN9RV09_PSOTE
MPLALWGVVGLLVLILANGMAWLGLVPVLPTFSRYCVGCAMIPFGPHWDPGGTEIFGLIHGCYLVDPASSHMLVSKIKPCMFKKLVVGPWVGSIGPPLVCTGWLVPSAGDALLALTGRVVPPDSDPIVLAFGIGVMINRDSRGHSYFIVRVGARRRSDTVLVSTINDADQGSADVAFRTPLAPYEKSKSLGSGGSMVARLKLKGIDGRAPPGVEPAA